MWKKVSFDVYVKEDDVDDIWMCPRCFKITKAPKIRTFDPYTICKHNAGTPEEEWYHMVKLT